MKLPPPGSGPLNVQRTPKPPAPERTDDQLTALAQLADSEWITREQMDAGTTFAMLRGTADQTKQGWFREIEVDLMKIDALDLAMRVCCQNNIRAAFDRMPALRHALDLIALRLWQIENESRRPPPRRAARGLPGVGR